MTADTFKQKDIDDALWDFEDISRFASITFFLDQETLKEVVDEKDIKAPIKLGVMVRYLMEYGLKTLKQNFPDIALHSEKGKIRKITFTHRGIPFEITVYHKNHYTIKNLDTKIYKYDQYMVPNNVDKFLKMRGILQWARS